MKGQKFLEYNNTKIVYIPVNKICPLNNDNTLDDEFVDSYRKSGNFIFHIPIVVKYVEDEMDYYFLVTSVKLFNVIKESLPGGDSKIPCFLINYETFQRYGESIKEQLKLIKNESSKITLLEEKPETNNILDDCNSNCVDNNHSNDDENNDLVNQNCTDSEEIVEENNQSKEINSTSPIQDVEEFLNDPEKCKPKFNKLSETEFRSFVEVNVKEYIKNTTKNKNYGLVYWRVIMDVCKKLKISPGKKTKVDNLINLIYNSICQ